MNVAAWLLAVVLTGLGGAGGGYLYGHGQGEAGKVAEQDSKAVKDLTGLITSHQVLIKQASAASKAMRTALTGRTQIDDKTTQELKDALALTADSRAGCVFDAGVMHQLGTARDRAATAASGGVLRPMPAASGSAAGPGG